MDVLDLKQKLHGLPFASQHVTNGAIVDIILDQIADGKPIGPQEMVLWISEMIRFAEKHQSRIERA